MGEKEGEDGCHGAREAVRYEAKEHEGFARDGGVYAEHDTPYRGRLFIRVDDDILIMLLDLDIFERCELVCVPTCTNDIPAVMRTGTVSQAS